MSISILFDYGVTLSDFSAEFESRFTLFENCSDLQPKDILFVSK